MGFSLVQSLVKFTVKHVGDGLTGGFIPIGSIAVDVYEEWCKNAAVPGGPVPASPPPAAQLQLRTELEEISQDGRAYRKQVEAMLAEMNAAEQVRARALAYLHQVPGRIQASMRRPDDPTGRTIPAGIVLRKADDLQPFLPDKMPRFKPGDVAVPGTDLIVQELLGVGGFGEVWKAVHKERPHAPAVALKFCIDEAAARSLRKEIELLDRVATQGRHKGIVELRYAHLSGSTPCLEYEFVNGGDLASFITDLHRAGKASPLQMAKMLYMLAQAVGHAHRLKPPIVHRDLKPQNVLTTRVDGKLQLKVADFGIGGIASDQAIQAWTGETARAGPGTLTRSAGSCTPLYASPQQRRYGPPDPRDDVYALGVIWFQTLSGDVSKEPPRGGSWKKKFADQGAGPEMVALLERCIEDDPAERPADAAVLAEELGRLIQAASGKVVSAAKVPDSRAAASATMPSPQQQPAEQWHYTREGQQVGPVSLEELQQLVAAGQVGRKDMVWTAKLEQWSQAGSIQGLCPELPPAPPRLPNPRVVGNVLVNARFHNLWFKITFDNKVLGESRLLKGCDFPFQTTAGDHLLEVSYSAGIVATKTKSYTISFREGGNYRITLQLDMGFFRAPSFAKDVQILKIPGDA
jgi:serine/threonine protein kinase